MTHFIPVSYALLLQLPEYFLGDYSWQKTDSILLKQNEYVLHFYASQRTTTKLFQFHNIMHVSIHQIKCLLVNFQPPQKLFIFWDVSWGNYGYSKDFSSHLKLLATLTKVRVHLVAVLIKYSTELSLITPNLSGDLFLKNNRNNLIIKCEKSKYRERGKLSSRNFQPFGALEISRQYLHLRTCSFYCVAERTRC